MKKEKKNKDVLIVFDGDVFSLEEAEYLYFTGKWDNNPENFAYLRNGYITMITTNPYMRSVSGWIKLN